MLVDAGSETENVSFTDSWKKSAFFFIGVGYWVTVLQLVEVIVIKKSFT